MKQKPSILHISQDEKFIDGAIHLFEKTFPARNNYIVVVPPANPSIRYISSKSTIKKIVSTNIELQKLSEIANSYALVILHGLQYTNAKIALSLASRVNLMWFMLGAELYNNPLLFTKNIIGVHTAKLQSELQSKFNLIELLKDAYRKIRYGDKVKAQNEYQTIAKAAKRIDIFGSLISEEYDFLKKNPIIKKTTSYQYFSYYPLDEQFMKNANFVTQNNILIGNSASYTNNHLEVFTKLSEFDLSHFKILVPLSYGNKKYAKSITKKGEKLFGSNFKVLTKFLSKQKYQNIMHTCGIIIMNHYRQQGVGNIIMALWQGSKVYLSEESILYAFFKRIGCQVYSIEQELMPTNPYALQLLSKVAMEKNRNVLTQHLSEDILVEKLKIGLGKFIN